MDGRGAGKDEGGKGGEGKEERLEMHGSFGGFLELANETREVCWFLDGGMGCQETKIEMGMQSHIYISPVSSTRQPKPRE